MNGSSRCFTENQQGTLAGQKNNGNDGQGDRQTVVQWQGQVGGRLYKLIYCTFNGSSSSVADQGLSDRQCVGV